MAKVDRLNEDYFEALDGLQEPNKFCEWCTYQGCVANAWVIPLSIQRAHFKDKFIGHNGYFSNFQEAKKWLADFDLSDKASIDIWLAETRSA